MAQKNSDSKTKKSKGKIEETLKEGKIVNVVADKVLIESKKNKGKTGSLSGLGSKIFGKIKLPPALEKYTPRGLNYYFNATTDYGRANVSKVTLGSAVLLILYFTKFRKKSKKEKSIAKDS